MTLCRRRRVRTCAALGGQHGTEVPLEDLGVGLVVVVVVARRRGDAHDAHRKLLRSTASTSFVPATFRLVGVGPRMASSHLAASRSRSAYPRWARSRPGAFRRRRAGRRTAPASRPSPQRAAAPRRLPRPPPDGERRRRGRRRLRCGYDVRGGASDGPPVGKTVGAAHSAQQQQQQQQGGGGGGGELIGSPASLRMLRT